MSQASLCRINYTLCMTVRAMFCSCYSEKVWPLLDFLTADDLGAHGFARVSPQIRLLYYLVHSQTFRSLTLTPTLSGSDIFYAVGVAIVVFFTMLQNDEGYTKFLIGLRKSWVTFESDFFWKIERLLLGRIELTRKGNKPSSWSLG